MPVIPNSADKPRKTGWIYTNYESNMSDNYESKPSTTGGHFPQQNYLSETNSNLHKNNGMAPNKHKSYSPHKIQREKTGIEIFKNKCITQTQAIPQGGGNQTHSDSN